MSEGEFRMPMVIRKLFPVIFESRREILQSINWQVRSSVWTPPTDVYETEESLIVRVEIAGMREEDFEVGLDNGVLKISGLRPDVNERRAYHQMEIWFGRFELAVDVPMSIDLESSAAEYKDGFLMVVLRKSDSKQVRVES